MMRLRIFSIQKNNLFFIFKICLFAQIVNQNFQNGQENVAHVASGIRLKNAKDR